MLVACSFGGKEALIRSEQGVLVSIPIAARVFLFEILISIRPSNACFYCVHGRHVNMQFALGLVNFSVTINVHSFVFLRKLQNRYKPTSMIDKTENDPCRKSTWKNIDIEKKTYIYSW